MQYNSKLHAKIFFLLLTILFLLSGCAREEAKQPVLSGAASSDQTASLPNIIGDLKISYLDVGQGDCSFIQLPNGETVLIDAGNQKNGVDIIQYIKSTGTDMLDYVIATHPHAGHIGGMAEVISAFAVKNIYMPKKEHTSKTFENLLATIEAKGLTIRAAKAGKTVFDYGNLKAEFLAPSREYSNLNNYSAVLLLTYNDRRFLFIGDAEAESEAEILSNTSDISADVLNGSDTSSSGRFLEAVKPSYTIISVGASNQYGHPDSATLELLQSIKAEIWRTDEQGTIVVVCDGKNITLNQIEISIQPNAPPEDNQNITVYITKSGTKYHRDGCRYLNKSKIPIALNELDTKKYAPCSVCRPAARK